ncbi:hypothetical protein BH10ACT2_BH10ACT2_19630 [soil metagenome]
MDAASLESAWAAGIEAELRRVRLLIRHTQDECALALTGLGAEPPVTQSDVSKWEHGTRPATSSRRRAVRKYVDVNSQNATGGVEAGTSFEDVVRPLTGERPLTDAQSQVRDDIQHRFREGPPLSPDDGEVFAWLVQFHGLMVDP